jgi:hypothetical protein
MSLRVRRFGWVNAGSALSVFSVTQEASARPGIDCGSSLSKSSLDLHG